MTAARAKVVERFYDFHPINARQILDAVAARGIAPGADPRSQGEVKAA